MRPSIRLWALLTVAGVLGAVAAIPYLIAVTGPMLAEAGVAVSVPLVALAQVAQTGVLVTIAAAVGVALAPRVGLDAPLFRALAERRRPTDWPAKRLLPLALGAGSAAALAVIGVIALLLPHLPAGLTDAPRPGPLVGLTATLYGGVTEEVLLRWGVLTALFALTLKLPALGRGGAFWTANLGAALLFGALHLPLAIGLAGGVTPLLVTYVLVGNGLAAVVFGWLYGRHGLEAAMIAHATADVWLHVLPALAA